MAGRGSFRMKLEGAKELEAALRELPHRLQKSTIRRALIKAGEPIVADARSRVPVESGRLQRVIQIATRLSRRQRRTRAKGANKGQVDVYIGAAPARYAHLVEFGSGPRRTKTGKSTGQMPAHPFLRPAWEAGKVKALQDFSRLLWIEIEKSAKRLAKRKAKKAGK